MTGRMRAQADTTILLRPVQTVTNLRPRRSRRLPPWLRVVGDDEEVDMPRVVIISSSGLVRFGLKRALTPRGFDVVDLMEMTGAAAARALKDVGADVVLLDSSATSPACRSFVRALREDAATARTPILLLAEDTDEARRNVLAAGCDGLVPEVDDFDALAATLRLHLKH